MVRCLRYPPERHSLALMPKASRNALANGADPENPHPRATSVMDLEGLATSWAAAFSMRTLCMKWPSVSPTMARNMRWKWKGEKLATRARSWRESSASMLASM